MSKAASSIFFNYQILKKNLNDQCVVLMANKSIYLLCRKITFALAYSTMDNIEQLFLVLHDSKSDSTKQWPFVAGQLDDTVYSLLSRLRAQNICQRSPKADVQDPESC